MQTVFYTSHMAVQAVCYYSAAFQCFYFPLIDRSSVSVVNKKIAFFFIAPVN